MITPAPLPPSRAAPLAVGAGLLMACLASGPFLIAGLGADVRWLLPVGFQALWCGIEGWHTARFRPGAIPADPALLRLPTVTGFVALIIALAALGECLWRLRSGAVSPFSPQAMLLGAVIGLVGVGLRQAAIRRLGNRFRDEVILMEGQEIETGGVYRWLAHPGETGFGLAMLGLALMCGAVVAGGLWIFLLLPLMLARVRGENRLLSGSLTRG